VSHGDAAAVLRCESVEAYGLHHRQMASGSAAAKAANLGGRADDEGVAALHRLLQLLGAQPDAQVHVAEVPQQLQACWRERDTL